MTTRYPSVRYGSRFAKRRADTVTNRLLGIDNMTGQWRALGPKEEAELRRRHQAGASIAQLVRAFGISKRTVYRYIERGQRVVVICRCGVTMPPDGRVLCHFCTRTEAMLAEVAA